MTLKKKANCAYIQKKILIVILTKNNDETQLQKLHGRGQNTAKHKLPMSLGKQCLFKNKIIFCFT